MNTAQVIQAKKYLVDFWRSINNRSLSVVLFSNFFKNMLEWDFRVWKKDREFLNQEVPADEWIHYSQLVSTLDTILDLLQDRVLKESNMDYFHYIDLVSKHVEKHKNEKVAVRGADHYYVEHFLGNFYKSYFDRAAESTNSYQIWEFFPRNWKITLDAISRRETLVLIALDRFLQWASIRISSAKEGTFDKALKDAAEELFPEVDPVRWSKILIFTLASFDPRNRSESVIRRPWNFGFAGRIRSFSGSASDEASFEQRMQEHIRTLDELEKKGTFEMVIALSKLIPIFHQTYTIDNLKNTITEIQSLEYPEDSKERDKKEALLRIFSELFEYV